MSGKNKILLIEDEHLVRDTIVSALADDGFSIAASKNAHDAVADIRTAAPDLILLDIQLPDGNGLELIATIRTITDVPVIIISGRCTTIDKVRGLEMGADDYITKPLQIDEMTARIKAQLRRYRGNMQRTPSLYGEDPRPARMRFGAFILDRLQMQAFGPDDKTVNLTVREFRMLEVLVMSPRHVHTREQLLNRVQCDNFEITDRAVDVQMLRIRRKLGDTQGPDQLIRAVRGAGYMLACTTWDADGPEPAPLPIHAT